MNALEIRDLTKHYTGFSLNHLNLTLPWGCIMGLVGENGAGKSTTIKLILNTISRDGGTVTILGRDNRENLCLSKEEISVVLDWYPNAVHAFLYEAEGYFAEEGLQVNILFPSNTSDPLTMTAAGRADIFARNAREKPDCERR